MIVKELNDKIAVITGGGSGIGKGIAIRYAEAGANVILVGRREQLLQQACEEMNNNGGKASFYAADVSVANDVKGLAEHVIKRFNTLDILVNCAGITVKNYLLDLDEADWDRVMNTNLKSVFLCSKYLGPLIISSRSTRREHGKVITISSVGSFLGIPTSSAYCASKGGVMQLTKVLAIEWAPKFVNVNSIVPGYIETPLSTSVLRNPEVRKAVLSRIPVAQIGHVKDTGEAALFLASQASNYITGITLNVDGGLLAAAYT